MNIAVVLFVLVRLMGFDDRMDDVEQRMHALDQRMSALGRNHQRIPALIEAR
ncbi:MAG: hypothetical protein GVY33_10610 [Alphaproteobacteria bacterium]|nr:hypothetical protein [Alphaproteobacteria bacterium]